MKRAPLQTTAIALFVIATAACGPGVDLTKALEFTDVVTGYHDAGVKDGKNYLKPSISFRFHNRSDQSIGPTQLNVAFWVDGADGEWDAVLIPRIHQGSLPPGATTEPILVRPNVGYTLEGARADFFTNSLFKDVTAKVFAMRSGGIVKLAEFKLDRVILPHAQ